MRIQNEASTAFRRFRSHGEMAALARVFDLTAQELLLVAYHVAAPGVDPEEMVQDTFIRAIEIAERFDERQAVEPWLLGILTNVARSAARRASRAPDPDRLGAPTDGDPVAAAEAAEFVAALHEAIDQLPVPMREAVTLHLVHGMTPTAIAHATSRPVGTVKSWIHRGLERLRDLLPAGFATGVLALALAPSGMAAARAAVLAHAASRLPAPMTSAAVHAGRSLMASTPGRAWLRLAAAAGAIAACVGLVAGWWWGDGAAAVPQPRQEASAAVAAAESLPSEAALRGALGQGLAPAARELGLRIQVRWHDGSPAGDVALRVGPADGADPELHQRLHRTNREGVLVIASPRDGPWCVEPDRGADVRVSVEGGRAALDVTLERGSEVRGQVRTAAGRPVAGAEVWLAARDTLDRGYVVARSDADGRYTVRDVSAGRYLSAMADGFEAAMVQRVPARRAAGAVVMPLVLGDVAGTATLTVMNPAGQPVANALVQIGGPMAPPPQRRGVLCTVRPPWRGRTDAAGRVTCRWIPIDAPQPAWVRDARHPGVHAVVRTEAHQSFHLPVTLAIGAIVRGEIRAAESSPTPLSANVGARSLKPSRRPATWPPWIDASCVARTGAPFALLGVPATRSLLRAEAADGTFAETELDLAGPREHRWSPVLGRGALLRGRVLGTEGQPLAGYRVAAVAVGHRTVQSRVRADGTFRLRGLVDRAYELFVRVPKGRGNAILARRYGVRPGAGGVELRVPARTQPSALVKGRAVDDAGQPFGRVALLRPPGSFEWLAPCDATGAFTLGPVAPGPYDLLAGEMPLRLRRPLEVSPGIDVDVGPLIAAPIARLAVHVAGLERAAAADVMLLTPTGLLVGFARVRNGVAELTGPPGAYAVSVVVAGALLAQRSVTLAAGQDREVKMQPAAPQTTWFEVVPAQTTTWLEVVWRVRRLGTAVPLDVIFFGVNRQALPGDGVRAGFAVPAGHYEVRCVTAHGESGALECTVPEQPPASCLATVRTR
ncbi:MAG: sigma-70 family RNA polymerase sigma factor [Planctomycetota bacterium]